jgi:hypothetical protein
MTIYAQKIAHSLENGIRNLKVAPALGCADAFQIDDTWQAQSVIE